jgi:Leucine-rich repeat (LRR) protein
MDKKEDFLESLSKYETFDSITHLNISNKRLKKIDILPKNLIELDCSNNQLTNLFSEKCNIPISLTKINCSHNKIEILKLDTNKNLKFLDCSYNKIKEIILPESVENVNMDSNKLSGKLTFKPNMKILSANKNLISSFDWENMPYKLEKLFKNNNSIETLEKEVYDSEDEERIVSFITHSYIELKNNDIKNNDKVHIHGYVIYEESD